MSEEPELPPEHAKWQPHGKAGHYCIAQRWCPCGHMNRSRNKATTRTDQRRGRVTIDAIEDNPDGSR